MSDQWRPEFGDPVEVGLSRPSDRLAASGLPLAPGGIVRPSGEPTSAALRRVTAERDEARAAHGRAVTALHGSIETRARLVDRALTLRSQRDEARAEVDRRGLALSKAEHLITGLRISAAQARVDADAARAELVSAREELRRLRAAPTSKEKRMTTNKNDGGEGGRAAKLLDLELPDNDADANTVRDYLIALLRVTWEDGPKRPFGNSGWHYDIYGPMIKAGLIPGELDSDGYVEDVDTRAADALVVEAIQALGATGVDIDGHVIEVRETGWTIMHPLACRPRLFDCEVNRAAERDLTEAPAVLGRFRCDAATGRFAIGAAVGGSDG